jgi:hypothetical protein
MNAPIWTIILVLCGPALAVEADKATQSAPSLSCQAPLFGLDAQGKTTTGSRAAVAAAAQRGDQIRVGFRVGRGNGAEDAVTHWVNAGFVSVFEGNVFTQLPVIHQQTPVPGKSTIRLADKLQDWYASVGTDGMLVSRMNDEAPHSQPVAQLWCLAERAAPTCSIPSWRPVFHNDVDGKPVAGSKKELFDAARRGDPIRISWGSSFAQKDSTVSVEHSAEAIFVSIMSGKELYIQVPEHILQRSYFEPGNRGFNDPAHLWRAQFGTDGTFEAVVVHRGTGQVVHRFPQRAAIYWSIFAPDPACDPRPVPQLALPDRVRARSPG